MPIAGLRPSPHRLAFRRCVRVMQSDSRLRAAVKTWFVWDGSAADRLDFTLGLCPAVAVVPGRTPDTFLGPSGFLSRLTMEFTLSVAGTNADDLFDLYHAIQRAFWPETDAERVAVRSLLLALDEPAGSGRADTGEVVFTQPRFGVAVNDDGPMLVGTGQATLTLETIHP
jgi:hypothetical protein